MIARSWSAPKRLRRALSALGLALAILPGASRATTAQVADAPTFAGTTTIIAQGVTGVTLRMPTRMWLPERDIEFSLLSGSYGLFMMGENASHPNCPPERSICISHQGYMLARATFDREPKAHPTALISTSDPPNVHAGLQDIYLLTDGTVRLVLKFPKLPGSATLTATGEVDGEVRHLPRKCLDESCHRMAYGGSTRWLGHPSLIDVFVYSYAARFAEEPAPGYPWGLVSGTSCIYPGNSDPLGSPDPDAHPYGCDIMPNMTAPYPWVTLQYWEATWGRMALLVTGGSIHTERFHPPGPGLRYIGFMAQAMGTTHANLGAYGVWLARGIGCPSGDFTDCRT